MWGNNETGVLQPVEEIGKQLNNNKKLLFHSDIVQGFVSTHIDFHKAGVRSAAMSAHKIGGPKGVGFMFLHNEYRIGSYFHGGKQELERRAGTVNVVGIAGFAAAVKEHEERFSEEVEMMLNEKNIFENVISQNKDIKIIGIEEQRLPHISNIQIKGVNSENLLVLLDLDGVGVSRGSACASGAQKPSHVLTAMGIQAREANSHLRISFGWTTQLGDGEKGARKVLKAIKEIL
jgi:cysteine desulfurase